MTASQPRKLTSFVGFGVHSLALVADAFHMVCNPKQLPHRLLVDHFLQFNDVLSLLVGLWAIRVATGREATNVYTYGVCSPPAVYKIVTKLRRHNYSGNALRRLVH